MKKPASKKIQLATQTVRVLRADLADVVGAMPVPLTRMWTCYTCIQVCGSY